MVKLWFGSSIVTLSLRGRLRVWFAEDMLHPEGSHDESPSRGLGLAKCTVPRRVLLAISACAGVPVPLAACPSHSRKLTRA
ncbi:unnamed protein product [Hydatigera taeniaeformis]|uniref:Secreted protein n=1 Tax=Hydatigena taeniaeformis TaxID=6205 RepID=A0A0R3X2X8_HYDTA|nr:unnamed protein product [Hydatigera taeniaeformis]